LDNLSKTGLVVLYTGPGKGKTTAALGLALRVLGHGGRVALIQFLKGQAQTGELSALRQLPGFTAEQAGRPAFVNLAKPGAEDVDLAQQGLRRAEQLLSSGKYAMVILDEVNVAAGYGLLEPAAVLKAVQGRAPGVHVVLTGRQAPDTFVEAADLVTVMQEVKHPFQAGLPAQAGIEY
jgi:cob(I)alamin adenosyltransferase